METAVAAAKLIDVRNRMMMCEDVAINHST